jgi:hypothetical protein
LDKEEAQVLYEILNWLGGSTRRSIVSYNIWKELAHAGLHGNASPFVDRAVVNLRGDYE